MLQNNEKNIIFLILRNLGQRLGNKLNNHRPQAQKQITRLIGKRRKKTKYKHSVDHFFSIIMQYKRNLCECYIRF